MIVVFTLLFTFILGGATGFLLGRWCGIEVGAKREAANYAKPEDWQRDQVEKHLNLGPRGRG